MDATQQQRAHFVVVGAFVDELVRSGVADFCVAPGSRSTPLAVMIARHPRARLWMHLDERSAAFFALGMAKARRAPVALVCTSGTAAANFLPAVAEAAQARVPLVVLTADRPHELREVGAPQTMDQLHLFGPHAKWFLDLPEPDESAEIARYTRAMACRAAALACETPAGPVHLNCPYREPLVPLPGGAPAPWDAPGGQPLVAVVAGRRAPDAHLAAGLAAELAHLPRGLIVCGPQDDPALPPALARLAAATGYPVLADPLSGARCGPHHTGLFLSAYDAFLRDERFAAAHAPQVVLRFGAMPISKPLLQFFERHRGCRMIVVDAAGGWRDPALLATEMLRVDGALLAEALAGHWQDGERGSGGGREQEPSAASAPRLRASVSARRIALPAPTGHPWANSWLAAERAARAAIEAALAGHERPSEPRVFAELARLLPEGATLVAGNSMPIRDLDTFFPGGPRAVRLLGNRGVNGIDGVVSTALGASAAGATPLVLAIGDISFYHDSNGLLAAKRHGLDATIILLNNDGGGIFSFLPQASDAPEEFEALFGTPHGLDFAPLATMYGARYTRPATWDAFRAAVRAGIAGRGLHIVEVRTDRAENVALHRAIWPLVGRVVNGE
jgi:2-succinyl-5-enolpyruvyl-6-hydroxy-3-cyclohexene-1-carboxylate synthase